MERSPRYDHGDSGETTHANYSFGCEASRTTLAGMYRQVIDWMQDRTHTLSLIQADIDQVNVWSFGGPVPRGLASLPCVVVAM